jgi:hypothetical protein
MSSTHHAISALLDNEPFDPQELMDALSDPAGRALLIDLVALRQIVQPSAAVPAIATPVVIRQRPWRLLAAAAALLVALAGGYAIGTRQAVETSSDAPAPTRVVQAVPFTPTGATQ